jgi:probable F420-dependent oxidoreductase
MGENRDLREVPPVKFGLSPGLWIFDSTPELIETIMQKAEAVGFESVWISDHLAVPAKVPDRYPYSKGQKAPFDGDSSWLDPLVLLSYIAGVTKKIKLGTAVYLLPLRNPHVTARAVVTLDRVSGGRLILGSGTGWMVDEFQVAEQDYENRGPRTLEIVEILKGLWTQDVLEYHGKYYDFGPMKFEPKPIQKPHPPFLFGGETPAALRRAVRLGAGWIGMWYAPEKVKEFVDKLSELRKAEGREGDPFEINVGVRSADFTPELFQRYADVGVDRVRLSPFRDPSGQVPIAEMLADLEWFGDEVIRKA